MAHSLGQALLLPSVFPALYCPIAGLFESPTLNQVTCALSKFVFGLMENKKITGKLVTFKNHHSQVEPTFLGCFSISALSVLPCPL